MINPKQSTRMLEQQLVEALKTLGYKRQALTFTDSKSHQTRLRLEIDALNERIDEYQIALKERKKEHV